MKLCALNLLDEKIENIEANTRSKNNYLILVDEHMKNKIRILTK